MEKVFYVGDIDIYYWDKAGNKHYQVFIEQSHDPTDFPVGCSIRVSLPTGNLDGIRLLKSEMPGYMTFASKNRLKRLPILIYIRHA